MGRATFTPQTLTEGAHIKHYRTGEIRITWGLEQWRVIAAAVWPHIQKHGREGLAAAIIKAQKALPKDVRRSVNSIFTSCLANSSMGRDPLEVVTFLMEHPQSVPSAEGAPPLVRLPVKRTNGHEPGAKAQPNAANDPPAHAKPAAPLPPALPPSLAPVDPLQAALALPLGVFAPALRGFVVSVMQEALRGALEPYRGAIAQTVREVVIEVIGAPAPAAAPAAVAPVAVEQPAPQPLSSTPPALVAPAAAEVVEAAAGEPEPPKPEPQPAPAAALNAHAKPEPEEVPHDLAAQMELAAQALGLPAPKRLHVCLVGVHPKTVADLERGFGRVFEFISKRQDEFYAAGDLPAAADVVLMCRKTLTHELQQATRRYNIPAVHVVNSVEAILAALYNIFPESRPLERAPTRRQLAEGRAAH